MRAPSGLGYLYCLAAGPPGTPGEDAAPDLAGRLLGIDGSPVRCLTVSGAGPALGSAAAWVGSVAGGPGVTVERAVQHDRVCDAAVRGGWDVLPARFGQTFVDDDALRIDLGRRGHDLAPLWHRIGGAVEMEVIIQFAHAPAVGDKSPNRTVAASAGTGRAYLERIAEPVRAQQRLLSLAEPVRRALRTLLGDAIREELVRTQVEARSVSFAHLVDRAAVRDYVAGVARLPDQGLARRALVSGPHAPYSFVATPLAAPAPSEGPPAAAATGAATARSGCDVATRS